MSNVERLVIGIICCFQGIAVADTNEVFVRRKLAPFTALYYIISNAENGAAITPELAMGSPYVFTRTESGHLFNIGSSWRSANEAHLSLIKQSMSPIIFVTVARPSSPAVETENETKTPIQRIGMYSYCFMLVSVQSRRHTNPRQ
jgi:hypothetical protein